MWNLYQTTNGQNNIVNTLCVEYIELHKSYGTAKQMVFGFYQQR
jgi:hypothetical protein